MFKTIHAMQNRDQRGFTLVELLIVVAIIAILAAIAIPQFAQYRKRGWAATLNSDAKNAFNACAAFFAADPTQASCTAVNAAANGYTASAIATLGGSVASIGGALPVLTVTPTVGSAAAGAVSAATIDSNGLLTPSLPLP